MEASTRLDALGSVGFGLSRSKMVKLIDSGSVFVDWKPITQASLNLRVGTNM